MASRSKDDGTVDGSLIFLTGILTNLEQISEIPAAKPMAESALEDLHLLMAYLGITPLELERGLQIAKAMAERKEALSDPILVELQNKLPRLQVKVEQLSPKAGSDTKFDMSVEFCCLECGGFEVETSDQSNPAGDVWCDACGHVFGKWGDLQKLGERVCETELRIRKLGAFAET